MPIPITTDSSIVNFLITALSLMLRQTRGRLMTALAKDEIIATFPAREAVIFPCMAMVAAAAVVLALLTNPPNKPVASNP